MPILTARDHEESAGFFIDNLDKIRDFPRSFRLYFFTELPAFASFTAVFNAFAGVLAGKVAGAVPAPAAVGTLPFIGLPVFATCAGSSAAGEVQFETLQCG